MPTYSVLLDMVSTAHLFIEADTLDDVEVIIDQMADRGEIDDGDFSSDGGWEIAYVEELKEDN